MAGNGAPSGLQSGIITFISAITVTGALVGFVGRLVLSPIDQFQIDTKDQIRQINLTMAPLLTLGAQIKADDAAFARLQAEIDGKTDNALYQAALPAISKQIDADRVASDAAREELAGQIHRLENDIVTRNENSEHWAQVDDRLRNIEERLLTLEKPQK